SDATLVKLMTDGILLTELQRDRLLLRYDTLIIDEAHERSLNIDFILGYLRALLPRRPDLKVIITSATIDPQRFSRHFSVPGRPPAPVIEVSGRTYPVEVRYRPLADPDRPEVEPRDQVQAIGDAVDELTAAGPGDILVFLSGEREIRDAADALAGRDRLEVLPLYARLSTAQQRQVFAPHAGRRVVLATNVAETSLTVPGIRYVIDAGTARISRYSHRTKVQRLPIEPVSRASASQRAGRCGRTSDGICVRLYSEEDFDTRPEFTDPEILRTNLASVILRMADLGLGAVADFPFVDPPDARSVADGIALLEELDAVLPPPRGAAGTAALRLTGTGRKLARLPVDPRLGRMILEAGEQGCVHEVLIIASGLSIVDPRERPPDARDAADALHARFAEPGSDFLTLVTLWDYLREQQRELSSSAFRRMCRREHLHYLRTREWQDVYGQLRQAAADLGIAAGTRPEGPVAPPADSGDGKDGKDPAAGRYPAELADRVHTALLAGLLSHIGMKDADQPAKGKRRGPAEFTGARAARFAIFPDSVLARDPPQWVVAAELVETSRLWARVTARIEPEWAEALGGTALRHTYGEPRWDARRGAAVATEKVTLYGLPIVAARQVSYGRVNPAGARELFIRCALVEGDWQTRHRFFHENRRLLDEAADLERRARRRGLVASDNDLFDFYDERIPASVTSARHFDSWWKKARHDTPDLLTFSPGQLTGPDAGQVSAADYPDGWDGFGLSYEFAPGEPDDGVSIDVPLARLNQVGADELGWQVPGLREELVTELIRSLPKSLRTLFVPAPDTARAVLGELGEPRGSLLEALGDELSARAGVPVPAGSFDLTRLPAHLRVGYRVLDGDRVLAAGKDLGALRRQLRPQLQATLAAAARDITRTGLAEWDFGSLPREFTAGQVRGYPALADAGNAVDIALFDTQAQAQAAMWLGTRRLLLLNVSGAARAYAGGLPVAAKLALSRHPYPGAVALLDDCTACAADRVIADGGGPSWTPEGFAALLAAARRDLARYTAEVIDAAARVLAAAHEAETELDRAASPVFAAAAADMRAQLAGLVFPGFVSLTGARRLPDLVRYLRAVSWRIDKAPGGLARDAERTDTVQRVTRDWQDAARRHRLLSAARVGAASYQSPDAAGTVAAGRLTAAASGLGDGAGLVAIRWMIEELRVSLFAQTLRTPAPVSERRIFAALDQLGRP
ncbi:MAG TPA: ATP-dependent RNA helicase HrpA, partial [Streptosporangiaceae bacterium]